MLALSDLADAFVFVAFWTIVHSLWQATILAGALAIWRRFVPEAAVEARSAAAAMTTIFLLIAPLATAVGLSLAYELRAAGDLDAIDLASLALLDGHEAPTPVVAEAAPTVLDLAWFSTLPSRLAETFPACVTTFWTLGAAYGAARLALAAARLRSARRRSLPAGEALVGRCRILAARCGLSRVPELRLSARASGPYASGLWRPMIVLPASWALETSPEVLEAAIAHELAHFRRGDLWILSVQRCVETLLFYHPGVWYVSRVLDVERERRSDETAARILGDPAAYAESLCRMASLVAASDSPTWSLPFLGETRMKLLERVRHVLRTDEAKARGVGSVGWLCLAPAALAVAFLGQATISDVARADDEDRETAAAEENAPGAEDAAVKIDEAILLKLSEQELPNASSADRAELVRRLSLDLTGRPATPEEVAAFVAGDGAEAYDLLVTRLLADRADAPGAADDWVAITRIYGGEGDDDGPEREEGRNGEEEEEEEGGDEREDGDDEGDDHEDDDDERGDDEDGDEDEDENEDEEDDVEGDDEDARERKDEDEDDDRPRAKEDPVADLKRMFAAEKRKLEEHLAREQEAVERQYKEQVAQAERMYAEAMNKLNVAKASMAEELDQKVARALAERQAAFAAAAAARAKRGENASRERDKAGDEELSPRERRMMEVIDDLETRVRELQSRLEGDTRPEGDRPKEGDGRKPEEKSREGDRPKQEDGRKTEDRPREGDSGAVKEGTVNQRPRSAEEAEELQRGALAERLYRALRSDEVDANRKPEFVQRVVQDVFGMKLDDQQVAVLLERSRGDLDGFRNALTRIGNAAK